jgi:hypothetical protein
VNETAASGTPSGLTVFRARLPYVDRRSLSEAWMSALGLQREAPADARPVTPNPRPDATSHANERARERTGPSAAFAPTSASRRYAAAVRPAIVPTSNSSGVIRSERRAPRPLAATVRSYPARRTSLVVGVDGMRVQLVLRREGSILHVVALCRSDVAQTVARALARADAFLRVRGDALRATVRTLDDPGARG